MIVLWSLDFGLWTWSLETFTTQLRAKAKDQRPKPPPSQFLANYSRYATQWLPRWRQVHATTTQTPRAKDRKQWEPRDDQTRWCAVHASQTERSLSDIRCRTDASQSMNHQHSHSTDRRPAS